MKIAIIGSGNIATFFAKKLTEHGFEIVQVISANPAHAKALAVQYQSSYSTDLSALNQDADAYVFAVKDDVLLEMAQHFQLHDKLLIHTAGSIQLDELTSMSTQLASIWCVYSINKNHLPIHDSVPLVVQANTPQVLEKVKKVALAISQNLFYLTAEQQSTLHLSAVFANNFVNHILSISERLLESKQIPMEALLPIIQDTVDKLQFSAASKNQTGPAIRHDEKTMKKHLMMLQKEDDKQIYELISRSIQNS